MLDWKHIGIGWIFMANKTEETIFPEHETQLCESAIDIEFAKKCGVRSSNNLDEIKNLVNLKNIPKTEYLIFPY